MAGQSFYFDPQATGTEVFLGPAESRLMELAWENKVLTVKQALHFMDKENRPAYTTVMTVLSRLAQKGLLIREREGRGFLYRPSIDRKSFIKQRVSVVSKCLKDNFSS